jgi:hypothetical protein
MGRFHSLMTLKKTKARSDHQCSKCGAQIVRGEDYYKEHLEDRFLHSLHAKDFCAQCFLKHGDALLKKPS